MHNACNFSYKRIVTTLQLGLLGLSGQVGEEDVAEFCGGFVEVVAHAVSAEALADDVEVQARRRSTGLV
jgi:hypothetical protein